MISRIVPLSIFLLGSILLIQCSTNSAKNESDAAGGELSIVADSATLISYCMDVPSEFVFYDKEKRKRLLKIDTISEANGFINGSMNDGTSETVISSLNFSIKQIAPGFVIATWNGIEDGADFGYIETEVFKKEGSEWKLYPEAFANIHKADFYDIDNYPKWPHSIKYEFSRESSGITASLSIGDADPFRDQTSAMSILGIEDSPDIKHDDGGFVIDPRYLAAAEKVNSLKYGQFKLTWNDEQKKFTVVDRMPYKGLDRNKINGVWYQITKNQNDAGYTLTKNCGGFPLSITISSKELLLNPGQMASQFIIAGFRPWGTTLHVITEDEGGKRVIFQANPEDDGITYWRIYEGTALEIDSYLVHERHLNKVTVKNVNQGCEGD
jgi:hypothetical protein